MALTINTNIKNDADGYLLDANGVKVDTNKMLDEVLPKEYNVPSVVVPTTVISQSDYDALEEAGEVELNRLYLVFEDGEQP